MRKLFNYVGIAVIAFLLTGDLVGGNIDGPARVKGKLSVDDSASIPPLNITERNTPPSSPVVNDIYLDDGTNTASGNPGWRRYTGSAWEDVTSGPLGDMLKSDFDANTILKADSDDTPISLTVPEQTLIGRITSGVITALTAPQVRTLLNVEDGADVTATSGAIMDTDFSANGIMVRIANGSYLPRTITGTANQIGVDNGNGVSGNPVIKIADDPILPGNVAFTFPIGTTAQETGTTDGQARYNSDTNTFRVRQNGSWVDLLTSITKLDQLATPDDNTNLDVSSTRHGLFPKLPNTGAGRFFDETGNWVAPAGGGDVTGPASAVDLRIVLFDGTTGKLIKDSGKTLSEYIEVPAGSTWGDIIFRGTSGWVRLGAGTPGQFLKTLGVGADPQWSTPSGAGDVLGPATHADNILLKTDGVDTKTLQATGIVISDNNKVTIPDNANEGAMNLTPRSSAPSSPATNDIYMDDGTNTASGKPGFRKWTGSAWEDVGGATGSGGGISGDAARLGEIQPVATSAASVYTNPASTVTAVKKLIIHNTNSVDEIVTVWVVPDSGGSVGTAADANRTFYITAPANKTVNFVFEQVGIILVDTNDTIQMSTATANKVTVQVMGATGVEYDRLTEIQFIGSSASAVYTNAAATTAKINLIIIHNTNSTAEIVQLWNVPDSGGSVGTAGDMNRFYNISLDPNKSIILTYGEYGIIQTDTNDTIQAATTTASKVTIQIYGDK